ASFRADPSAFLHTRTAGSNPNARPVSVVITTVPKSMRESIGGTSARGTRGDRARGGRGPAQQRQRRNCDQDAEQAAGRGEQQAVGEHLSHEPIDAGPGGGGDREVGSARARPAPPPVRAYPA